MRISEETKQRIRDAIDIQELVGNYVDLKPAGKQWKGRCPFHQEKTPSFFVTPEFGSYKCFGCGASGDGIRFLMEMEHVDFPTALRMLAERYHIPLEAADPQDAARRTLREVRYKINEEAARFFYHNLLRSKRPQQYLMQRGLKASAVNDFYLGYADGRGESLYRYLTGKGYQAEDLLELGLIARSRNGSGYYDKFRDRLMFPIFSVQDRVIGFGGRALGDRKPKYLNSPDSDIFHKGEHLYALNRVRKHTDRKHVILVEGYMDVVSLFYHGVPDAVASLGTSLTEKQAALIKRYNDVVYLCYDGDTAGIRAARRAIDVFAKEDIVPRLVTLPDGKDPDDIAKTEGAEAFEEYLKQALDPLDFELRLLRAPYDLTSAGGRLEFLQKAVDFLANIPNAAKRDVMAQSVAQLAEVEVESVRADAAERKAVLDAREQEKEQRKSHFQSRRSHSGDAFASDAGAGQEPYADSYVPDYYEEADSAEYGEDDPWYGTEEAGLAFGDNLTGNSQQNAGNSGLLGIQSRESMAVERYRLERESVRLIQQNEACEEILSETDSFIQNAGLREILRAIRSLRAQGLPPQQELLSNLDLSSEAQSILAGWNTAPRLPVEESMAYELKKQVARFPLLERKALLQARLLGGEGQTALPEERLKTLSELQEIEKRLRAEKGGRG